MTHDRKPPRQPLFWAALVFSLGLWTGVPRLAAAVVVGDCGSSLCFCVVVVSS